MKSILIVDDHKIIISGISNIINKIFVSPKIDYATNEDSAIEKIKFNTFDLIILDIHMPNSDIFSLIRYIHFINQESLIMVFTMNTDLFFAKRLLQIGVKGYVTKNCEENEIIKAITSIFNNTKYISNNFRNELLYDFIESKNHNPFESLSEREISILNLLISGNSNKVICKILNLQPSTICTYKKRIFEKCGCTSYFELIKLYELYQR